VTLNEIKNRYITAEEDKKKQLGKNKSDIYKNPTNQQQSDIINEGEESEVI